MYERLGICFKNSFTLLWGDCPFSFCDTGTLAFEGGKDRDAAFSVFDLAGEGAGGRLTTVGDGFEWRGAVAAGALATGSVASSVDDNRIGSTSGK
jgi:hypothetical protein